MTLAVLHSCSTDANVAQCHGRRMFALDPPAVGALGGWHWWARQPELGPSSTWPDKGSQELPMGTLQIIYVLDLYAGCGGMSHIDQSNGEVEIVTRWAVDMNSSMTASFMANWPQAKVPYCQHHVYMSMMLLGHVQCWGFTIGYSFKRSLCHVVAVGAVVGPATQFCSAIAGIGQDHCWGWF